MKLITILMTLCITNAMALDLTGLVGESSSPNPVKAKKLLKEFKTPHLLSKLSAVEKAKLAEIEKSLSKINEKPSLEIRKLGAADKKYFDNLEKIKKSIEDANDVYEDISYTLEDGEEVLSYCNFADDDSDLTPEQYELEVLEYDYSYWANRVEKDGALVAYMSFLLVPVVGWHREAGERVTCQFPRSVYAIDTDLNYVEDAKFPRYAEELMVK
ncbi:MAG: hypothetical protein HOE90_23365 [Bacteriovoracaceae bacterium]|jgi:hypothetical protein|nr:hypothetical protein [Bacteriovoracaceae bacterium]